MGGVGIFLFHWNGGLFYWNCWNDRPISEVGSTISDLFLLTGEIKVRSDIEFFCHFGDELKKVNIFSRLDAGSGGFQIMVDNYYQGDIYFKDGQWRGRSDRLTMDDIQALGELIDAENISK